VDTAPAGGASKLFARGEPRHDQHRNDSRHVQEEPFVRTDTRRSRVARLWAALAALVVVPATLAVSISGAGAAGSNTLTVKAGEYTYQLKGSPKAGWTQIDFSNAGVEDHMLAMFKLKKGTTAAALKTAVTSSDQAAFEKIAAPGGDPTVSGGPTLLSAKQSTTTYTQLAAGTYGIACFVPAPDGKSHAEHGMFKVFTIAGKSSAKPPTDGVTAVSISDSAITTPPAGIPAHGWVKVTNDSSVARDLTLAEYTSPDATFDQANTYFNELFSGTPPAGDAPASLNGGLGGIAPGATGYFQADLSNGRYVVVSSNQELDDNDPAPLHTDFTVG
jgi:hypothetical protein